MKTTTTTFQEKVQHFAISNKSLFDFSRFCKELHSHIEWKIDDGNSKTFSGILSTYLDIPDRIFDDQKSFFIFLCDKFKYEFLLLYELSQDKSLL